MQGQDAIDGKIPGSTVKAVTWTAALPFFAVAWNFLQRFYFVRELFVFVVVAALLVFLGANFVLLGILLQEAARGIARHVPKAQTRVVPPEQFYASSDLHR